MIIKDREYVLIIKAFSTLAVIGIHYLTHLSSRIFLDDPQKYFYLSLDQLFRFTVPMFVALSGYAFSKKYLNSEFRYGKFLFSQFKKIFPFYLVWSGLLLLAAEVVPQWSRTSPSSSWWEILLYGKADYHLYFIPMIFVLYSLFPILRWLLGKAPKLTLVLSLCLQAGLYYYYSQIMAEPERVWLKFDQHQYIFFASWIGYFVLGMYLARFELSPRKILGLFNLKKMLWLGAGLGLALTSYHAISLVNSGFDPIIALRFTKISTLIFGILTISWLLSRPRQLKLPRVVIEKLIWLGQVSLIVYLSHTLALRIIFTAWHKQSDAMSLVAASGVLAIGWVASLWWMGRTKKVFAGKALGNQIKQ